MPTKFLERNKKETKYAALLLLLLRWKRGVIPQLLVVMLLMLVFFAPQRLSSIVINGLAHIPLIGQRLAAGAAAWSSGGDEDAVVAASKGSYQDMMAAINASRAQSEAAAAAAAAAAAGRAGAAGAAESTDLVRGKPEDIKGQVDVKGGASVAGVQNPTKDQAVQLTPDDLQGQRAFDEAGFGAGGQAGMLGSMLAGAGPFAGSNFFSGRNSASVGDNLQTALGQTNVPSAKNQIVPGNGGHLSRGILSQAALKARAGARAITGRAGNQAFRQLADGRTRAMLARDPVCTTENNCAPEYASTNTGAIYDGSRISGATSGVITTGQGVSMDGIAGSPMSPTAATEATLGSQADQVSDDQKKCQAAEAKHKPVIDAYAKSIQDVSTNMHSGGCCSSNGMPPGFKAGLLYAVLSVSDKPAVAGCGSESQARQCDNQGTNMSQLCQDLDNEMLAYYNECPLMQQDGPYQHYNCVKSCSTN